MSAQIGASGLDNEVFWYMVENVDNIFKSLVIREGTLSRWSARKFYVLIKTLSKRVISPATHPNIHQTPK